MTTLFKKFTTVTPHDTNTLSCKCLWIGVTGNLALSIDGSTTAVTFKAVPVGRFKINLDGGRVMSTNTTATDIVALS